MNLKQGKLKCIQLDEETLDKPGLIDSSKPISISMVCLQYSATY